MIKAILQENESDTVAFYKQLCQQCIGRDLMLSSTVPPQQSQPQKHGGYTVRKAVNNAHRGRSIEEKRKEAAEQCLQTIVRDRDLSVEWKDMFLEEQMPFISNIK